MINRSNRRGKIELTFVGGVPKRYRRWHESFEAAQEKALEVLASIPDRAAHPAILYGPGCGRDGTTVS